MKKCIVGILLILNAEFDDTYFFSYTTCMGKIDEVKEILNTLRVAMSIGFGVFVLIVGKLVSLYTEENFSEIFWITVIASILNIMVILVIVLKISQKTKEIKDL